MTPIICTLIASTAFVVGCLIAAGSVANAIDHLARQLGTHAVAVRRGIDALASAHRGAGEALAEAWRDEDDADAWKQGYGDGFYGKPPSDN